jgi:predicted N-acetyltransferase YhbS
MNKNLQEIGTNIRPATDNLDAYIKEETKMTRTIKTAQEGFLEESLDFVEKVFTESEDTESGKLVRSLVKEIRSKRFYVPELDLVMVNEENCVIGLAIFSKFHLDGKYENQLLLLSPVAVKTELQRQHISKDLIEAGFEKAKVLGYEAVIVEGNPQNYNSRGFVTSYQHGIVANPKITLPAVECLMVKELVTGALSHIKGTVDYSDYECLQ